MLSPVKNGPTYVFFWTQSEVAGLWRLATEVTGLVVARASPLRLKKEPAPPDPADQIGSVRIGNF